jgi:hypothetical protein
MGRFDVSTGAQAISPAQDARIKRLSRVLLQFPSKTPSQAASSSERWHSGGWGLFVSRGPHAISDDDSPRWRLEARGVRTPAGWDHWDAKQVSPLLAA